MSAPRILIGSFPADAQFAAWITERLRHYLPQVDELPQTVPRTGVSHIVFVLGPGWDENDPTRLQELSRQGQLVLPLIQGAATPDIAAQVVPFEDRSSLADTLTNGLTIVDKLFTGLEQAYNRPDCSPSFSQIEQGLNNLNEVRTLINTFTQEDPNILALLGAIVGKGPLQELWDRLNQAGSLYGTVQSARHVIGVLAQHECLSVGQREALLEETQHLEQWNQTLSGRPAATSGAVGTPAGQMHVPQATQASRNPMVTLGGCALALGMVVGALLVIFALNQDDNGDEAGDITAIPVVTATATDDIIIERQAPDYYLCQVNLPDYRHDSLFMALDYEALNARIEPQQLQRPALANGDRAFYNPEVALIAFCDEETCNPFVQLLHVEGRTDNIAAIIAQQLRRNLGQAGIELEVEPLESRETLTDFVQFAPDDDNFIYVSTAPCVQ